MTDACKTQLIAQIDTLIVTLTQQPSVSLEKVPSFNLAVHTLTSNNRAPKDEESIFHQPSAQIISQFAFALVHEMNALGVNSPRLIKGLAKLCVREHIFEWLRLPNAWLTQLTNTTQPSDYRVKMLLINELGHIPYE